MLDGANATLAFIDHGEVQLDVNGFHAHIELELSFDASVDLLNFSIPLPSIPITPFAVGLPVFRRFLAFKANGTIRFLELYNSVYLSRRKFLHHSP